MDTKRFVDLIEKLIDSKLHQHHFENTDDPDVASRRMEFIDGIKSRIKGVKTEMVEKLEELED
ncbi:MAG TPA: hypothetical protein EYQ50_16275 [Verrucomicrobiales bacterium]|jgi:hypothetical protein|nr:hypothetical protein [Verrucomicrobiales bacterium]HIL69538.1 hypothetical protein [Verrucomicrobiota bacterium]